MGVGVSLDDGVEKVVLHNESVGSAEECEAACLLHEKCISWVYVSEGERNGRCSVVHPRRGCTLLAGVPLFPLSGGGCKVRASVRWDRDVWSVRGESVIEPPQWEPVPLGQVAPQGWLLGELVQTVWGLSGHLSLFWPDVNASLWVGGSHDTTPAGPERGPYWLNGVVPLAALLSAAAPLDARAAAAYEMVVPQVLLWVREVLGRQRPDGWLGPNSSVYGTGNQYWSSWEMALALLQYGEWQSRAPVDVLGGACGAVWGCGVSCSG